MLLFLYICVVQSHSTFPLKKTSILFSFTGAWWHFLSTTKVLKCTHWVKDCKENAQLLKHWYICIREEYWYPYHLFIVVPASVTFDAKCPKMYSSWDLDHINLKVWAFLQQLGGLASRWQCFREIDPVGGVPVQQQQRLSPSVIQIEVPKCIHRVEFGHLCCSFCVTMFQQMDGGTNKTG